MAISVVRCPFCDRRYNVTGIPSGTRVLCTSCRATLTVPALRRAIRPSAWRRLLPRSPSGQIAVGLVGGLMLATAAYLVVRPRAAAPDPGMSYAAPILPAEERPPAPDTPLWGTMPVSRDDQIRRISERLYREFGTGRFQFYVRPSSCFMLAGEVHPQVTLYPMFEEFDRALESLRQTMREEFGEPLGLGEIDEILPVVIFTSRETFDEYMRRGNNQPLPPEVPGVYEYSRRRVVFLYGRNGYPIEVLLHEAVHQMMHYWFRRRADQDRRQSWWFQEGMATYFEPFQRSPTGHVVVDPVRASPRLPALRQAAPGQVPPLFELMGMDVEDIWEHWKKPAASPDEQESKMRFMQLCYARAWALVHYLRHGADGKYRGLFDEYLKRELEGKGGKDEFVRLLSDRHGIELGKLEHGLEEYVHTLR